MYNMEKLKKKFWSYLNVAVWVTALVMAVNLVQQRVADVCLIPSYSMESTILAGDRIVVLKTGMDKISRNDLIIFNHPDGNGTQLVKRCIGMPGDAVMLREGMVFINGTLMVNPPAMKWSQADYLSRDSEAKRIRWERIGKILVTTQDEKKVRRTSK